MLRGCTTKTRSLFYSQPWGVTRAHSGHQTRPRGQRAGMGIPAHTSPARGRGASVVPRGLSEELPLSQEPPSTRAPSAGHLPTERCSGQVAGQPLCAACSWHMRSEPPRPPPHPNLETAPAPPWHAGPSPPGVCRELALAALLGMLLPCLVPSLSECTVSKVPGHGRVQVLSSQT